MIELTEKHIFPIAQGLPTHWTVCIIDKENSEESCNKIKQQILSNQKIVQNIRDEVGSLDLALDSFDEDTEAYKQLNELKLKYQKLLGSEK